MNKELAFQRASSNFLTEGVPYGFLSLTEENQNEFILNHAWQPFEDEEPRVVFEHIESLAKDFEEFELKQYNYIVSLKTLRGEVESYSHHLVVASNNEEAVYKAFENQAYSNIDGDNARVEDGSLWDLGDEICRTPYEIAQVTDEEYAVLKKYL